MGTIWIREFTGGLDTRRLPETSAGGLLIKATDCHISRGGEVEQRPAFVDLGALTGTIGLAWDPDNLYVFGHTVSPGGLPAGVLYQQLVNPDTPASALVRIRSWDLYAGKMYVAAEFADGNIFHFYDGVNVAFWFDGKARATFEIVSGAPAGPAVAATGTLEVVAINTFPADVVSILINSDELLGAPISYNPGGSPVPTSAATFAGLIASGIAGYSGTSGYTATVNGTLITITAVATGPGPNGAFIYADQNSTDIELAPSNMSGGSDITTQFITSVLIGGVEALSAPVAFATAREDTAASLAAAMDLNSGTTGFEVTNTGPTLYLTAAAAGVADNGKYVNISAPASAVFSPTTIVTSGGVDGAEDPGAFVRTVGKKMYALGGPNLFFSGIATPTQWNVDTTGAGFIDMSTESSGAENLLAIARYQNLIAIFSETVIQTWYVDPDPSLNKPVQTLNNTGTICGLSVVQMGDTDLFYLDITGIRSLQSRSITNSAGTTDIGIPVDTLVIAKLATMTDDEKSKIIGIIEPRDGRLWMIMKNEIFVFSFFNGAKVSAWSTYTASTKADAETDAVAFNIDYAVNFRNRLYARSTSNRLYAFGGTGATATYDATVADVWLPFLDANEPMRQKQYAAIDAVARGQWLVSAALDPNQVDVDEEVARVLNTTYGVGSIDYGVAANHISLRFRSEGANEAGGPNKLAAAAIHYDGDANED